MSERTILTAGPVARLRAEAIAARLAQTNPAAAATYAEGAAHRANAEIRPEPPPPIERPPREPKGRAPRLELSAKAVKVTLVVDSVALAGFAPPNGPDKVRFQIEAGSRRLTGGLNPKSVRKAIATVAEHGLKSVACVIQGKLEGDVIEEAGIVAQVKGQPSG